MVGATSTTSSSGRGDEYYFILDGLVDDLPRDIQQSGNFMVLTAPRLISPPQQDAGTGGGLGSAVGHDVVLERAARQEPGGETTSPGRPAWLADVDFERLLKRGRSAD